MTGNRKIPRILAAFAIASLIAVVYLSAIPLQYQSLPLADVWNTFLKTPWLDLALRKRADWVANGLVMIPFGFFFAGSFLWPVASFQRKQSVLIGFAVVQAVVVCAIEAMQICFPPRVVSLNDMLAGFLGGLAGILLWNVLGNRAVRAVSDFPELPGGFPRFAWLVQLGAIVMLIYAMLPLDLVIVPSEWAAKFERGYFRWMPLADIPDLIDSGMILFLLPWSFPLGIVLAQRHDRRNAMLRLVRWCVVVGVVTIPVYGRLTSPTPLLISVAWGLLGVAVSDAAIRLVRRMDRPRILLAVAVVWTALIYVGFLARAESVVTDRDLVRERLSGIFAVPFARAQKASEMEALANLSLKIAMFASLGFLITRWIVVVGIKTRVVAVVVLTAWILLLGIAVEVSQGFLLPLIADVTDLVLYAFGGALGVFVHRLLYPRSNAVSS